MARTKTTRRGRGIVESAVDAVEELGEAASSLKESWSHVQKARGKGAPAARAASRAGKKAWSTTKKVGRATTKAATRMLPGKKRRTKK